MNINNVGELPVLFIGHGSPMNAVEENEFSEAWKNTGRQLPRPRAIMCISAHWFINELAVTAAPAPDMIYDFYGFPENLYGIKYSAPGTPELAGETSDLLRDEKASLDLTRGLDHGAWSVLCRMFPEAEIPVYQMSINAGMPAQYHFEIGRKIRALRRRGVLLIGSGNIVHNLRMMNFRNTPYDWAEEFDARIKNLIEKREFKKAVDYANLGKEAALSIPTPDHYYPLLYILGAAKDDEEIRFFAEGITLGSISMRSLIIG